MTTTQPCVNCSVPAHKTCESCHLVPVSLPEPHGKHSRLTPRPYCGRECQVNNWAQHKLVCKSRLAKQAWQPAWITEGRAPAFMGGPPLMIFGAKKYLWGNVPAYDVLQLSSNEDKAYSGDLRLLFAASGDIRNVIKTIASLPVEFTGKVESCINDKDLDVVARNIILLLIALVVDDEDEAVECMIHTWYSASIRPPDMAILENRIRPLIEEVVRNISNKPSAVSQRETWTFGQNTCTVEMSKTSWTSLLRYLENVKDLTMDRAQQIRSRVTLAPERVDYRDRQMLAFTPARRLCAQRFREDGLLLPFGASRLAFSVPNPTIFQGDDWPMKDSADPLDGWSLPEILKQNAGPASNDVYGKLHRHLFELLRSFHRNLSARPSAFRFLHMDVSDLADHLRDEPGFDRIETSNIADSSYLHTKPCLVLLSPLLKTPALNRHATLLTLYMNAVDDTARAETQQAVATEYKRAEPYIFKNGLRSNPAAFSNPYSKERILLGASRTLFRDGGTYFGRFMRERKFDDIQRAVGLVMKKKHTIVGKWPMKLRYSSPSPDAVAQKEFDLLQASGHSGSERYVEWKWA